MGCRKWGSDESDVDMLGWWHGRQCFVYFHGESFGV